ncbi:hypothetical protein [Flavobacterium sp. GCM10027622]|uniref:hypothetical protein n=1 Tax=unclassified Flavobacterium TaxID=196869 RepID=UPI00361CDCEC
MKFKIEHLLFPVYFLLLCSFIKIQNKDTTKFKTEFKEICLKISNEYKNQSEHGHVYNNKTEKMLSLPSFSKILKQVSAYDLNENLKYKVEKNKAGKIERILWKPISKNDKIISFEKLTFETIIEQEYNGKVYQNKFIVTDFLINRNVSPKRIYLRIAQNEFEKLSIDNTNYHQVSEFRLVGIDDAIIEFDESKNK